MKEPCWVENGSLRSHKVVGWKFSTRSCASFRQLLARETLSPTNHKIYCHCYWLHVRTKVEPPCWQYQGFWLRHGGIRLRLWWEVPSRLADFCGIGKALCRLLGAVTDSVAQLWVLWAIPCHVRCINWSNSAFHNWLDVRPFIAEKPCICYNILRQKPMARDMIGPSVGETKQTIVLLNW